MNSAITNSCSKLNITVKSFQDKVNFDIYKKTKIIITTEILLNKLNPEETIYCLAAVECYDINLMNLFYQYYNCVKDIIEDILEHYVDIPIDSLKKELEIELEKELGIELEKELGIELEKGKNKYKGKDKGKGKDIHIPLDKKPMHHIDSIDTEDEEAYDFRTLESAKEFFDSLDTDGDGLLTSKDIAKLLYINEKYPLAFHFNIYSYLCDILIAEKRIEFHKFMMLVIKY